MQASENHGDPERFVDKENLRDRLSSVDWVRELIYLIAVLAAIALALSLAGRRPGWSIGQTPPDPMLLQIYAAHFRHGDFFPVWSSSDAYGMGTPVPLFYQKAFFMVGGLMFIILGGALKATLVVTLAIFMVIGSYGMRKALSVVTDSRLLQDIGSIGFLLTNWTFAEWLIRGDLAEFSAFMVVPWLLYSCLTLVKERRLSWLIIPVIVVLVDAHNVVALISIFALIVTGAVFLACYGFAGLRSIARRLALCIGLTSLILAPMVIAEVRMGEYYDPAQVINYENHLIFSFTFARPWWYLFDPSYHWLSRDNLQLVPFQLDFAITLLLVIGLFTVLILWGRKFKRKTESELPRVNRPVVIVLVVSLAVYLFMQFRISYGVYTAVWQLHVSGYPFRMMTFAVPLALILAIVVADWYLRVFRIRRWPHGSWVPSVLAAFWLASIILLSPITSHEPPAVAGASPYAPFEPIRFLTPPSHASFQTSRATPLFAEYLPKVEQRTGIDIPDDVPLYDGLHNDHIESESLSSVPCSVVQTSGTAFESLRVSYKVTCKGRTRLALPISYNSFTSIDQQVSRAVSRPVAVLHVPMDPRIVIQIQSAGSHSYAVQLPTLTSIIF